VLDLEIREMVADKKNPNIGRTTNLTDSADNGTQKDIIKQKSTCSMVVGWSNI
jgi:hypothetical protein